MLVATAVGAGEGSTLGATIDAPNETQSAPSDPDEDVLGWENGIRHDESIAVNQSDGLSQREREALVARGMARVEVLREREFCNRVPVEVVSRSAFREFLPAYRKVLAGHDATRIDDSTWTISDGGFADAFGVTHEGRTVTIVNGPNVASLSAIHPQGMGGSPAEDRVGFGFTLDGNAHQFYSGGNVMVRR